MKYYKFLMLLSLSLLLFISCQKRDPQQTLQKESEEAQSGTEITSTEPLIKNLRIEDEILKWDAVEGASRYIVAEGENRYETTDPSLDIFLLATEPGKTYTFCIDAIGADGVLESPVSSSINYEVKKITWVYQTIDEGAGCRIKPADLGEISGKVVIPNEIRGIPVTDLASWAFDGCTSLTSVIVGENIENIGYAVFEDCKNLTRVSFSDSVLIINNRTFYGCESLWDFNLPPNLQSINTDVLFNCKQLTMLHIPDTVEKIYSVNTLASSGSIGGCASLVELTVDPANPIYRSENNCVIRRSDNALVMGCTASIIPQGVTKIERLAFYGISPKHLTVPDTVVEIGENAFKGAVELQSITLGNSLSKIDALAFQNCTALQTIELPAGLTELGELSFSGCASLQSLTVNEKNEVYQSIGNCILRRDTPDTVLFGCVGSVIPEGIRVIGDSAFSGYSGETIYLPEGIQVIGNSAFSGYSGETIYLPEGIERIENWAFNESNLRSVTLPSTVKKLGYGAFSYSKQLAVVELPEGLEEIGDSAFCGCKSLTQIDLPKGLISIGCQAFSGSGAGITLPSEVATVGEDAFEFCMVFTELSRAQAIEKWGRALTSIQSSTIYNCVFAYEGEFPYVTSFSASWENKINHRALDEYYLSVSRAGYTFAGWATEPNGAAVYLPKKLDEKLVLGSTTTQLVCSYALTLDELKAYTEQDPLTLYAVWVKKA